MGESIAVDEKATEISGWLCLKSPLSFTPGVSPGNTAKELPSPRSGGQIVSRDSRTAVARSASWVIQLYRCRGNVSIAESKA